MYENTSYSIWADTTKYHRLVAYKQHILLIGLEAEV